MIDLKDYDISRAEAGEDMAVRFPETDIEMVQDDGTPVVLTLAGIDSAKYRAIRRQLIRKRQEASARDKNNQVPQELMETEGLETVVGCLLGWKGIVIDGEAVEFTAHNARNVLRRLPWLIEQSERFIYDRKNFMNGLPNGSAS